MIMYKPIEERNFYKVEELLQRAARMTKLQHEHLQDLCTVLRETAMKGGPADVRFNHWLIHYNILDEFGTFKLHWIVCNGVTGRSKTFFTKDWVSKSGNVMWRKLASAMVKV